MEHTLHKTSARDFFLYLLVVVALYINVWRLIDLWFSYIDILIPDTLHTYYTPSLYQDIRTSMATLIVFFPVYLGVTWFLRKDTIAHPEKREFRVRKWLLNFTLFLAGLTMIIDLVTLVNSFLNGELTVHFFLKVLVVFVVAAGVFSYYLWDLRRETTSQSKPSKALAAIASIVVLGSIIAGFFIAGTPGMQRLRRFDDTRISHLQMLQNQIVNYWSRKNALPKDLNALKDDITGFAPPVDPETAAAYEYKVISARSFELCATFATVALEDNKSMANPYYDPYIYNSSWQHEKGRTCFARTIDPQLNKTEGPIAVPMVR